MDRKELKATTYQMRNFYLQFRDGFFTNLDVMNYIQHLVVARMMRKGFKVLDMCCGRSLLLPLMRYNSKEIDEYVGIDIEAKNIRGDKVNICNGNPIDPNTHYPFKTRFVVGNVAEMPFEDNYFDLVIYTSSIEHMQKEDGAKSLVEAYRVMKNGGAMFLSCPNTPEYKSGYDTQYRAHIYEWKISELEEQFKILGFSVMKKLGLGINRRELISLLKRNGLYNGLSEVVKYIPSEFLLPVLAIPYYKEAKEILYIVKK